MWGGFSGSLLSNHYNDNANIARIHSNSLNGSSKKCPRKNGGARGTQTTTYNYKLIRTYKPVKALSQYCFCSFGLGA